MANIDMAAVAELQRYMDSKSLSAVQLFKKLDKDGKKGINYISFKAALKEENINLSEKQMDDLIKYVDFDSDGKIEESEFKDQMEKYQQSK